MGIKQTQSLQLNCLLCLSEFNIGNRRLLVVNSELTLLGRQMMGKATHLMVEASFQLKLAAPFQRKYTLQTDQSALHGNNDSLSTIAHPQFT